MPATVVAGQPIAFLVDSVDIAAFATRTDGPWPTCEAKDATPLNNTGWKVMVPGLKSFTWAHSGMADFDPGANDDITGLAELGIQQVVTAMPNGVADGDLAYIADTVAVAWKVGGKVGDLFAYDARMVGRGNGIARGTVLHPYGTARTVSGTGVARQLGALTATQTMHAALHIIGITGTTPSVAVTLQSAPTQAFTSPTNRATFTAATARGSQWATVAGAVTDTWWRVIWTITGTTPSASFNVAAGIGA